MMARGGRSVATMVGVDYFSFRSRPISTLSLSTMLPISWRSDCGSFLMRVGTATIWSPLAKAGCWRMSTTSKS